MLDFFVIFTKGGIVLWCFEGTKDLFAPSINALVKSVLLQVGLYLGMVGLITNSLGVLWVESEQKLPLKVRCSNFCLIRDSAVYLNLIG